MWEEFVLLAHQIQVHSQITKLLTQGQGGLQVLQRLGTLHRASLDGLYYLPWYHHSTFGYCSWERPGARPITVEEWAISYREGRKPPGWDVVESFIKMSETELRDLGSILVIYDPGMSVSVIVEGSKRACAWYLRKQADASVLQWKTNYGHMLFPSDFFVHAIPPPAKAGSPLAATTMAADWLRG